MIADPLIACLDVDYRATGAVAAGLWFRGWSATSFDHRATVIFAEVANYQPGAFYLRELPCLVEVLTKAPKPEIVIVDGYVDLEPGKPGLGRHLYEALHGECAVVGVAKTRFQGSDAELICRGRSRSPLYVTAAGLSLADARAGILAMAGEYRIPDLLKAVDRLSRTAMC
jgi:deoxyribonuclease V